MSVVTWAARAGASRREFDTIAVWAALYIVSCRYARPYSRRHFMPSFPGVDYLDFDSVLSDEEKLARNTARQFVDAEIMPIIEEYNREGKFPVQLVPQMADLGLFGASLKGYGCAGMSNVEYGLVTQELERGDSGLRSFVSVQSALV